MTVVTQAPRGTSRHEHESDAGCAVERHPLPIGSSFDVPSVGAVRAATSAGRFDVVWVHHYHTPLAWAVAERATSPIVFTPHFHGTGSTFLRTVLHKPYRLAGGRLLRVTRNVVTVTMAEAEVLWERFPGADLREKTVVVPIGVADPARGPHYACQHPVVLTVARQERYKRTDLLVRAAAELRRRGAPIRLVVVGDGPALDALRALANRLDIAEDVTFTGRASDDALARWWASARLYASASEQEAFGISVAQALQSGLPVVASGVAAHREVVRMAGPDAATELVDCGITSSRQVERYADAIEGQLLLPRSREEQKRACTLPTRDLMAARLHAILSAAADATHHG